jgi:hypothetical protein
MGRSRSLPRWPGARIVGDQGRPGKEKVRIAGLPASPTPPPGRLGHRQHREVKHMPKRQPEHTHTHRCRAHPATPPPTAPRCLHPAPEFGRAPGRVCGQPQWKGARAQDPQAVGTGSHRDRPHAHRPPTRSWRSPEGTWPPGPRTQPPPRHTQPGQPRAGSPRRRQGRVRLRPPVEHRR